MKICKFLYRNKVNFGVLENDFVYKLAGDDIFSLPAKQPDSEKLSKTAVKFLAPVTPSKIVCVGRNYSAHAAELGNEVPPEPMLFLKAPSAVITDGEAILIPPQSVKVEHEGELAVIIKKTCKNLNKNDNVFDFVFGYTCLNDVTARDLQKKDVQFTRAKSFDTFCPIGAFVESNADVSDLSVKTFVNGTIKQEGRTSQMVFSVDFLIRYVSNQMTLYPGDIIATGTPAGVSKLSAGDVCRIEIEKIGSLTNPVKLA